MRFIILIFFVLSLNLFAGECDKIEKKIDEFTGKISYTSPDLPTFYSDNPLTIYKDIDEDTIYYFHLRVKSPVLTYNGEGVYIIFNDKTMIQTSHKIKAKYASGSNWRYSAFIRLAPDLLKTLSEKTIVKFRLYLFDKKISSKNGERFKQYVNCIQKCE